MLKSTIRIAAVGAILLPTAALADVAGRTTTDLSMRAGPGTNYEVLDVAPEGARVNIVGCVKGGSWCEVTYSGERAYGYGRYIAVNANGGQVAISEDPSLVGTVVGAPIKAAAGVVDAVTDAVVGVADATANAIDPTPDATGYVESHPVQPIYVRDEVVVGSSLPNNITLHDVPNYEYAYANVNGEPVLVQRDNRRVVHVYR